MNYKKMTLDMGICLNMLTDYQLDILQRAINKEKEEREKLYREKLAEEYTDRLNDFVSELNEKGLILDYDEYEDTFRIVAGN